MRGHYEEEPAVVTERALKEAARRYAGAYLQFGIASAEANLHENRLTMAAIAYVEATKPRKKVRRA